MPNDAKVEVLLTAKDMAAQAFGRVNNRIQAMTKQVFSLNTALAGMAAATSFGYVAKRAIDATAEIERNAEMAGVSIEAYQELIHASRQYDISQEALTDGLKELNLRADEFIATAGGSAAEAFRRLGYSQLELNDRLKDAPALLEDIIRRMQGLDRAAQIRIADELFGGQGGEQFVRMIRAGADELNNLRQQAHELGIVIDTDIVKESVEAKRQVDTLTKVLQVNFQKTIVSLAPLISDVAMSVSDWVRNNQRLLNQDLAAWLKNVASGLKDIATAGYDAVQYLRWVGENLSAISHSREDLLRRASEYVHAGLLELNQVLTATDQQLVELLDKLDRTTRITDSGEVRYKISVDTEGFEEFKVDYDKWVASISGSTKPISPLPLVPDLPTPPALSAEPGPVSDWLAVNAPGDAADQAYREIERMLQRRNEMFQKSNRELTELTRRTAWEMQGAMADLFFDAITKELKSTEDYVRAFLQSLARIASEAISQILLQKALGEAAGASSGSGYGWVGSLANLAVNLATRDSGGPVSAGGMYEIGVPEILHTGGKQYLMMGGNQGGYVEPLKDGTQGGQQNIRIINALDPSIVEEWANSPSGERVIMNIIRRNQ